MARPWIEKAAGTFRALVDRHNTVAKAIGVKYVPIGILVDESGTLVRTVGNVNIDNSSFRRELVAWVTQDTIPTSWSGELVSMAEITPEAREADARFQLALSLLDTGKKAEAVEELAKAFRLDPENWLIRKQFWAIDHPEAFYAGRVDFDWQKAQIEREGAFLSS